MMKITVWYDENKGWCVQKDADPAIYVFGTKRAALNYLELELDTAYGPAKK